MAWWNLKGSDIDFRDPQVIGTIAGLAIVLSAVYWLLWRRSPKLANWIVFGALTIVICSQVNWDYLLNDYFRVRWQLP